MDIDESIRLKPIWAYLSFISIMSLCNNDLLLVEQVSKSAGTQQTHPATKRNHCYIKNSVLSSYSRNNDVLLYTNMYIAEDEQSLHNIITSAIIIYHKMLSHTTPFQD